MVDEIQVSTLDRGDVAEMDALFRGHTGRPLDRALITSWIEGWPSVGARVDGDLVGYGVGKSFAPDIVELASLLVAPTHRGAGVGTAMATAFEADCRARGAAAMIVVSSEGYQVVEPRSPSQPFYRRLGYQTVFETDQSTVMTRTLDDAL